MFTGIVEELGEVRHVDEGRLAVTCSTVTSGIDVGASVAVSGVCLTVVERTEDGLSFDLSPETRARTTIVRLRAGDRVNLERPVTLASLLGGHLVQGHVDGVGQVVAVTGDSDGGAVIGVSVPAELARYLVEKGSIAIDGVSLTIASMRDGAVNVALIPHTLAATTLGSVRAGDPVNLEADVLAKYVDRLLEGARG